MTNDIEESLDELFGLQSVTAGSLVLKVRVLLSRKQARALATVQRRVTTIQESLGELRESIKASAEMTKEENAAELLRITDATEVLDEELATTVWTGIQLLCPNINDAVGELSTDGLATIFNAVAKAQRDSARSVIKENNPDHPLSA